MAGSDGGGVGRVGGKAEVLSGGRSWVCSKAG